LELLRINWSVAVPLDQFAIALRNSLNAFYRRKFAALTANLSRVPGPLEATATPAMKSRH